MVELRLWVLRIVARRVYDRRVGLWRRYSRIIVGSRVLRASTTTPPARVAGAGPGISISASATPWRSAGPAPDITGRRGVSVGGERSVDRLRENLRRLRELGFNTPYEAWLCVEHGECPDGVDYGEVFSALMDYLEALSEQGESPEEGWERRYMEEAKERRKVTVPA